VADDKIERMRAKTVGEIMIPLDEYPHVPDRFTLAQAMLELKLASIDTLGRKSIPRFLIVFNDKNQLVGICRRRDLMRGLEPRFMQREAGLRSGPPYDVEFDPNLLDFTSERFVADMRRRAQKPISEVMIRDVATIDYDDHIMKAAFMIVHHNITCLPVIKEDEVVGVVRTVELFHEIAELVIEE
jgi:CBS-domain-containing membrane protein